MSTFLERLKIAMESQDMRQVDLVSLTGLSKSRISQYVTGVFMPKYDALVKLAKALNVSESWLAGQDSEPATPPNIVPSQDLTVFNYEDAQIRTVFLEGEQWWVLKDVCDVLALSDTNKVSRRLDDDDLTRIQFVSGGQTREMYIINEPGLYSVILRSDKPEAKAFKRWVTHEVLPQIRRTGAFVAHGAMSLDDRIKMANAIAKASRYTLPHILKALGMEDDSVQAEKDLEPLRMSVEANVIKFLAEYESVVGKPTNVVYKAYGEYCQANQLTRVTATAFSNAVKQLEGVYIADKKIHGVKYRIFTA